MAKPNQKCVRMSNDVLKIVESYRGEGFNDKFENLVNDFEYTIPKRKKELDNIEKLIQKKQKELKDLELRIYNLDKINFSINTLKLKILDIDKMAAELKIEKE